MAKLNKEEQEIVDKLHECLGFSNPPKITQERFDAIVEELIKKDKRETMWRLCGIYIGYNFNKVIDYYIEKKDSYYVEELVCFVDGELDQEYLVNKMIETNDKEFVKACLELYGETMQYCMDNEWIEKLLNFVKIKG